MEPVNWYPPCWDVTIPERIEVTRTRGRLCTPIAKSWPVKSRIETCPVKNATRVRQARIPIPPACCATVAPMPPMARTRPGGVFIIISILCKSECHRAAYTEREQARRRTMAKRATTTGREKTGHADSPRQDSQRPAHADHGDAGGQESANTRGARTQRATGARPSASPPVPGQAKADPPLPRGGRQPERPGQDARAED